MDAETHLGQTQAGRLVVAGDAISTGQRQLQAAPQTVAVNHGRGGEGQRGQTVKHLLTGARELSGARGIRDVPELTHVGTDDETTGLSRADDQAVDCLLRDIGNELIQLL